MKVSRNNRIYIILRKTWRRIKRKTDELEYTLRLFKVRNTAILYQNNRKQIENQVNLHWFSLERSDHKENVGDYLSTVVCDYMLLQRGISLKKIVNRKKNLYAIGSIIDGGAQNATVWGSGLIHGEKYISRFEHLFRKLDVRCVRGPETMKVLRKKGYKCPNVYGDPAILMPFIYKPRILEEKQEYVVVLHHQSNIKYSKENKIDIVTSDYKQFIDKLVNSKLVISSSLHGIILAEAYGIPAILLEDSSTDDKFKYDDYYQSTGRSNYPIAPSIEDGIKMTPLRLPNLKPLQENLIKSFPYDLWE